MKIHGASVHLVVPEMDSGPIIAQAALAVRDDDTQARLAARVLAAEVAPYGITVNCVAPGRVETDMTAMVDSGTNSALANAIPAGRMGTPDEVAAAVGYFVSEQAAYSTGAILDVNGGSFMP